jgi:hypothetical protein
MQSTEELIAETVYLGILHIRAERIPTRKYKSVPKA